MPDERTSFLRFSDDQPIRRAVDDRLGRTGFAHSLARAIHSWRGRESLVIALHGPWGSGKSSIKNIAIETLRAQGGKPVRVAEFNPWQFANRDQLARAFFDQVGLALGRSTFEGRSRLAGRWRRYAAYLRTGTDLLATIRTPAAIAMALVAVAFFGVSLGGAQLLGLVVGGGLLLCAALLHWSSRFAEAVQGALAIGTEVGQKSIPEMRDELTADLRRLPEPLLVVVDDVDRLTPTEALEMLQLVKANADFPNVVYLLLYDRETLEKSVGEVLAATTGRAYLEKIVQISFDIPIIEGGRLRKVLFEGLDALLADERVARRFDEHRWGNIFLGGLAPYFTDLRRVNRFLSTLSFHVGVFSTATAFEVNPLDLLSLEVLRMFEPDLHRRLPLLKPALTQCRDQLRTDETKKELNELLELSSPEHREHVKDSLRQLFPPAEWAWGGMHYGSDFSDDWYRELRVCSEDVFDRYFTLAIPEGDVSETELADLLSRTGDRARFRAKLEELAGRNLLPVALDRLEAYKQKIDPNHAREFITAIFDVGDRLPYEFGGMFTISAQMHANRIVYWYLKRDAFDDAARAAILADAIRATDGVALPVEFVQLETQAREKSGEGRLVSAEDLQSLRGLCVEKIGAAANSGRLLDLGNPLPILYSWDSWAGSNPVKEYCGNVIASQTGALKLLRVFLQQSISHGMGEHVGRRHYFIKPSVVETFVDFEALRTATEGIDPATLAADDARALTAFRKALQDRAEGKHEDRFRRDDD